MKQADYLAVIFFKENICDKNKHFVPNHALSFPLDCGVATFCFIYQKPINTTIEEENCHLLGIDSPVVAAFAVIMSLGCKKKIRKLENEGQAALFCICLFTKKKRLAFFGGPSPQ